MEVSAFKVFLLIHLVGVCNQNFIAVIQFGQTILDGKKAISANLYLM